MIPTGYTCNGSPKGCEAERFGGCAYHFAMDGMKWFNSLSQEQRRVALEEQGPDGTVADAYRDWLAEHEACAVCGKVMHCSQMLRPSAYQHIRDLVCSRECENEWCRGPEI